jgi:hypothetical protein
MNDLLPVRRCSTCEYKIHNPDPGYCYMFEKCMGDPCPKWTPEWIPYKKRREFNLDYIEENK